MKKGKSFLLIRYSSLGDVILATSVVENIARQAPGAQISFLTKKQYSGVFYNNPHVDKILTKPPFFKKYDYLIDLHNSLRSNVHKIFISDAGNFTYNKAACARRAFLLKHIRSDVLEKDVIERYLQPLKEAGLETKYISPKLYLTEAERKKAMVLTGKKNYVVIAPGAKWETKKWIPENYFSFAVKIIRDLKTDVVLVGDEHDKQLCSQIKSGVGIFKKHVTDISGETSIRTLAAVIEKAKVLVTMDSAPLHIGRALKTNTVVLFGPTVKEFGFQPREEYTRIIEKKMECRPCSLHGSKKCRYKDRACMKRIAPYEVFNGVKDFISTNE